MKIDVSPKVHRALSLQASLDGRSMRDIADDAISAVIDSRIWELMGECEEVQPIKSTISHSSVAAKVQSEKSTIDNQEIIEKAKSYILTKLDAGEEPLVAEVADHVGTNSRPFGVLMRQEGIEAKNTTRKGRGGRRYTLDMIELFR